MMIIHLLELPARWWQQQQRPRSPRPVLPKKRRYPTNTNGAAGSGFLFTIILLLLCAIIINASGAEELWARGRPHHDNRTTGGVAVAVTGPQVEQQQYRRHLKKKGSAKKHFSLDTLVDGFDGDDEYFVSYNDKKKKKGKSGKKTGKSKKCKGKAGKKKKKSSSSSSSSSSDDSSKSDGIPQDCTSEPTMLSNTTYPPTLTPTLKPTAMPTASPTMPPTIAPTVTRNSTSVDDDDDGDVSSSKKSKERKSKKKKSKKGKMSKRSSEAAAADDTAIATTTSRVATRSHDGTNGKGKLVLKFRSEIPINIPFPSRSPLQVPLNAPRSVPTGQGKAVSIGSVISFTTDTPSAMPSPWSTLASSSRKKPIAVVDTSAPAIVPSISPTRLTTNGPSIAPPTVDEEESSSLLESESADARASETAKAPSSPVLVEASPFYITFSLDPAAASPSRSAMHDTITASTTFLKSFVNETFALVDASVFLGLLAAHSYSSDFQRLELMTVIEFDASSDFIPSSEDIDMLLEIAFTEPSVSTLLTLLSKLPADNPFQQTVSVIRTEGHFQLNSQDAAPSSSSGSSWRGVVAGTCAAAFLVAAFAAAYRNRHKYHRTRKLGYNMTRPDVTRTSESTCLGTGPPLIERLVDDDSETNTIEFYGEGDDDPDQSNQGSLFESPFLHAELPRSFNEV